MHNLVQPSDNPNRKIIELRKQAPEEQANTAEQMEAQFYNERLELADVMSRFKKWLYLENLEAVWGIEVTLAAVAANRLPGDPVWLLVVASPGHGKTEGINTINSLPDVHPASTLSESSLMSGTSKKDKAKNATGGILKAMGQFGIITVKDFSGILSMNKDSRGPTLAALREIYDGSWDRPIGADGGHVLHWDGKAGLIGGCTPSIDRHHEVMSSLGERFVFYRLPIQNEEKLTKKALKLEAGEDGGAAMRKELSATVNTFFANWTQPEKKPSLSEAEEQWLISLSRLAVRCRGPIDRDPRTREIVQVPGTEAPTRLAKTLYNLFSGLVAIGEERATAWKIIRKVGIDSMPQMRLKVFNHIFSRTNIEAPALTTQVAEAIDCPTNTTRRALEDLNCYELLDKTGKEGTADNWTPTDLALKLYKEIQTLPEIQDDI